MKKVVLLIEQEFNRQNEIADSCKYIIENAINEDSKKYYRERLDQSVSEMKDLENAVKILFKAQNQKKKKFVLSKLIPGKYKTTPMLADIAD